MAISLPNCLSVRNIFKCFVSIKNDHDSIILPPEKADFKASSLERESYFKPGTNQETLLRRHYFLSMFCHVFYLGQTRKHFLRIISSHES